MILRWEKAQPLSPLHWKISCPLGHWNSLDSSVPENTQAIDFCQLPELGLWNADPAPHTKLDTQYLQYLSYCHVSSLCYHLHGLGHEAKGEDRAHKYMYPHKYMENTQPRQTGAMQWPTLRPQFCCLSQLQFSQEPEGKEDRRKHNAMDRVQDSTLKKRTLFSLVQKKRHN